MQALFAAGRPIVAVMASGALIRLVAPLLSDKMAEPAVIAVPEDGSSVVPLLGGHHGANDLAQVIAAALKGHAAITTAGDLRFGIALDAPPAGLKLANADAAKAVMAELVAGAAVLPISPLEGEMPGRAEGGSLRTSAAVPPLCRLRRHLPLKGGEWSAWLAPNSKLPFSEDGAVKLTITDKPHTAGPLELVYHPATLALGMGCERGCDPAEAIALAERAIAESGYARQSIAASCRWT